MCCDMLQIVARATDEGPSAETPVQAETSARHRRRAAAAAYIGLGPCAPVAEPANQQAHHTQGPAAEHLALFLPARFALMVQGTELCQLPKRFRAFRCEVERTPDKEALCDEVDADPVGYDLEIAVWRDRL